MQWLYICILTLVCSSALAKVTILGVDNPPLLFKTTEGINGLSGTFGKMVAGAIKKANKEADFEVVWIPQKRALAELDRNVSGIFMPFSRTPDRENKYHWLLHLGDYDSLIYAIDPKIKITSLLELKKFKIGVLAGSIRERELRKVLGPNAYIEAMTEDQMNYRMLKTGRIDVWIAQQVVVEEAQKKDFATTGEKTTLYIVRKMMSHSFWLAGNLALPEKDLKNLRLIFGTPAKFHQTSSQMLSAK
jgi:ABC-type amino acid transport substrate-binding protein